MPKAAASKCTRKPPLGSVPADGLAARDGEGDAVARVDRADGRDGRGRGVGREREAPDRGVHVHRRALGEPVQVRDEKPALEDEPFAPGRGGETDEEPLEHVVLQDHVRGETEGGGPVADAGLEAHCARVRPHSSTSRRRATARETRRRRA